MKRHINLDELVGRAKAVRENAYAPYSKYRVGAALLGKSGRVYVGCNVENASYGLALCSERSAVVSAVSAGEREFDAIAVVTENGASPCGACRQVLLEFMSPKAPVIIADATGSKPRIVSLGSLLPGGFTPAKLKEGQSPARRSLRKSRAKSKPRMK